MEHYDFLVVGGGIAGICCAESLCLQNEEGRVAIVTSTALIKKVVNYKKLGFAMENFDIAEADSESIESEFPRLKVIVDDVVKLDAKNHCVDLGSGRTLKYGKICLCAGAKPKLISPDNPYVIGIRDVGSAKYFQSKVENARRVIIVGNGGIAMEIAYELTGCEVIWVVREDSINVVFLDPGAAQFLLSRLQNLPVKEALTKRSKYSLDASDERRSAALGPDWHENFSLTSKAHTCDKKVTIEYGTEVKHILMESEITENERNVLGSWPVYVQLKNSKTIGADIIVSATGVRPDPSVFLQGNDIAVNDADGGILVDSEMRTSEPDVYAAGDVCFPNWHYPEKWVHMRLWSQARVLGVRAAKCMTYHRNLGNAPSNPIDLDIALELFTHVTKFCGLKVVLLGLFNSQRLRHSDILLRINKDVEYVKAVVSNGRLMGALLIGDTDLEETFENLLLNDIDISAYGDALLDPNIDLADYFD